MRVTTVTCDLCKEVEGDGEEFFMGIRIGGDGAANRVDADTTHFHLCASCFKALSELWKRMSTLE